METPRGARTATALTGASVAPETVADAAVALGLLIVLTLVVTLIAALVLSLRAQPAPSLGDLANLVEAWGRALAGIFRRSRGDK